MADTRETSPASADVPLCVDLDGTLLMGDLLWESVLRLARENPLRLLALPLWLARGRARLKQEVSDSVRIDPELLPYNAELVQHLRQQRADGRRLILVTASHERPARAVARHLALFDDVIATDGRKNLKGRTKRRELVRRFGEGGFDYAGDSRADLDVWPAAREVVVVNASSAVRRRIGDRADKVLDARRHSMLRLLFKAMRPQQWAKNLLLFLPVLLAHRYLDPGLLVAASLGFVAFSLGASAVYVGNDLLDIEADRRHPKKRERPFASGELSLASGVVLCPLLGAAAVAVAWWLPLEFLAVLGFYFVINALYTTFLKEVALLDVLILAGLFTTRIIAGSAVTGIVVSEWLLAFSMFIFLSLAAIKRYAELLRIRTESTADVKVARRGYYASDLELILQMGISSGYMAVLVLALYITSDVVATLYAHPRLLWFVCPLLLFWVSRIWLLAHRGQVQEDPLNFAIKDPATWVVALLSAGILLAASRGL